MRIGYNIRADESYQEAEQRARQYFRQLIEQLKQQSFVSSLTKDLHEWKKAHTLHHSIFSLLSRDNKKPPSHSFYRYINWLNRTGKLEDYLDRSISYIFMRDLGKALDSPDTQRRIQRTAASLKNYLTQTASAKKGEASHLFSFSNLYRMAQNNHIESAMIWLFGKLKTVSAHIPDGMNAEHAQRKLIKIIAGILMHEIEMMGEEILPEERMRRLDRAIRLGYAYGLTYPFIDDLLDANVLSAKEKEQYSDIIRTTLVTGEVKEIGLWQGANHELVTYVHTELREAFQYIKQHQPQEKLTAFLEESYIFFHSQELDRLKDFANDTYSNEDLYVPIILKSSSSRSIVRSIINSPEDKGAEDRTFYYGIYNQLADDMADIFEDLRNGAVTPYTYYLKYHEKRPDLINPFEMYWTVIHYLIHHVYHSDAKTCALILDRAINGLKRFKERAGNKKYKDFIKLFALENAHFHQLLQNTAAKADHIDFFDKLLRDQMITSIKKEREDQEEFSHMVKSLRNEINGFLTISQKDNSPLKDLITGAANYSLDGSGKRLRPIVAWVMGVHEFGMDKNAVIPLLKSLEYMHTASLIFDDLPSQDDASVRRGRPTVHMAYNTAIAELTGLFLTQKAIEEQTFLDQFEEKSVLRLVQYSAQTIMAMCKGQAMDLDSRNDPLTLDQLHSMSFYKTGIAFEASLVMPAILANKEEKQINRLKTFAYHAGIAFQIKDDLLDVEGDIALTGKPVGIDAENNKSTYVSILGLEEAKKAMWEHYCLGMEALQDIPSKTAFLKVLLTYMVNRDR